MLGDGFGVTWSLSLAGGDSSSVSGGTCSTSKNVRHIQTSVSAFTAALGDGFVVTWAMQTMSTLLLPAQATAKLRRPVSLLSRVRNDLLHAMSIQTVAARQN